MTGPHDPMAASGRGGKSRGALRYFFLFALQTTGTAILLWYAVPLVRQVLLDPGQSCTATGEFGMVVVGDHVDADRLLDRPPTSAVAPATS